MWVKNNLICLATLFICLQIMPLYSDQVQPPDSMQAEIIRLELKDGSSLIGHLLWEDETIINIKTLSGIEIEVPVGQIEKREVVPGVAIEGQFWPDDPNSTRLLFAPTGRALKAGQGYFAVYEIFFPFVAVGITDYFTLAGGMTLVPGAKNQLFYLAPKITPVQLKELDLSAGVLYISIPDGDNSDDRDSDEVHAAGIVYGVSTYGNEKNALTFGLGYGFAGEDFAEKPVIVIGGELRASKSIKLITENWLIPGEKYHLISLGLRFFGERLAADFALMKALGTDENGFPFAPWVGFAFNFGKAR
jgi:hypothetical protein